MVRAGVKQFLVAMQCPRPFAFNDMLLPCGHCIICKTNKMSDWLIRIVHEAQASIQSLFVTLTYDNDHLVVNDDDQGILVKADLQKFFKRLRKQGCKVRYYAVGEYGTKFGRPHYHVILFAQRPIDFTHIQSAWNLGRIHVGTLTPASAAYTLKYVFEKKGDYKGRPPPFATMSRKGGIGHWKIATLPKRNWLYHNNYKKRLPRFYKDKMFSKEEKIQLREATIRESEMLIQKDIEYLRQKGYEHPEVELKSRSLQQLEALEYRRRQNQVKHKF